jgi:RNA recognition motif-containing protein
LKPALPRDLNQKVEKKAPENKKIFIGGLPKDLTLEEFREYFEKYGEISDIAIISDKKTKEPRGNF